MHRTIKSRKAVALFICGDGRSQSDFCRTLHCFLSAQQSRCKRRKNQSLQRLLLQGPSAFTCRTKEDENRVVRNDDFAAVSALIQNLQLLAWDQGIGMVWKSGRILYDKGFQQDMGLKENERFAAILHIGYPEEVL